MSNFTETDPLSQSMFSRSQISRSHYGKRDFQGKTPKITDLNCNINIGGEVLPRDEIRVENNGEPII